jgi:acyl-CoA synthetase (AMP-forming)/AMP-acid ligase II
MGLIGCSLGSLYGGGRLILLPPDLKNPRAWLEAITTYRGSITVSPDFGYRNCMRNIYDLEGLDLSCLRLAFSGAEPVRLSTIEGFEGRFGLKHVVSPAYGLAEATLAVAAHRPGEPLRLDPSGKWVSVGQPLPGIEVAIWQGGAFLSPGEVGEIVVRTPAVMQGYYGDPEGTASAFRSGWLHTGDLGFVDREGYLYVTGRDKDLIVVGGQNLVPGDVETVVDSIPGIRYSAAVGLDVERMGTQQLVVAAELREEGIDHDACSHLVRQITAEVHRQLGFRPGRVLLVSKHAIPLTSSGKIQHGRLIELIASGEFREQILYPPRFTHS